MDSGANLSVLVALSLVILSVMILGQLARKGWLPFGTIARQGDKRLSVASVLAIDTKRRLMIIQCDGREALVLLSSNRETMLGWLDGDRP